MRADRSRLRTLSVRLIAPAAIGAVCAGCSRGGESEGPGRSPGPPPEAAPAYTVARPAPVPAELEAARRRIAVLQHGGRSDDLVEEYPRFLARLEAVWGAGSAKLIPYHYDYCVALRSAGLRERALGEVKDALERWPASFRHRIVDATVRMELSHGAGYLLPGTEEAVRRVLHPAHRPLLHRSRTHPADLHLQWSSVLYESGRLGEALREARAAVVLRPDVPEASMLEARILIALRRSDEALAVMEKAGENPASPAWALLRGAALLETGEATKAWEVIEEALRSEDPDAVAEGGDAQVALRLRATGGAALNRLGRFAESRELLLDYLVRRPDDAATLHHAATSLRGLDLDTAAHALADRARKLVAYRHHLAEAEKSRRRGLEPSVFYHEGRAWLAVDRAGDALRSFEKGLRRSPSSLALHAFVIETLLQVGRLPLAFRRSVTALETSRPPAVRAIQARLLARAGRLDQARDVLASLEGAPPDDPVASSLTHAYAARARVELGDTEEANALLRSVDDGPEDARSLELALLCRAAILIGRGKPEEADALLSQEPDQIEGGAVLARALRLVTAMATGDSFGTDGGGAAHPEDLSDLVDHPWLALRARSSPALSGSARSREVLAAALSVIRERNRLLGAMQDLDDREILDVWRELLRLYLETGTLRKAREAAWYLWSRNPDGAEENRLLVRSLARDEDIVSRLSVIERALDRVGDDPELIGAHREAREFLGVAP